MVERDAYTALFDLVERGDLGETKKSCDILDLDTLLSSQRSDIRGYLDVDWFDVVFSGHASSIASNDARCKSIVTEKHGISRCVALKHLRTQRELGHF